MNNKYSLSEFITNIYALLCTKLFFPKARFVRRPVYVRGKKSLVYKNGLTLGYNCRFDLPGDKKTLFIGENCEIGDNVHIVAHEKVVIGNNVLMASKIFISDTSHGIYNNDDLNSAPNIQPKKRKLFTKPILIGNNVWIGENVCVLCGVTIGNGCIIGANSLVNHDVKENSVVVGIPARVIKRWNDLTKKWEKVDF